MRAKTTELLKETSINHSGPGLSDDFLDMTPKHKQPKKKIEDWSSSKLNFMLQRHYEEYEKTNDRMGENICKLYI